MMVSFLYEDVLYATDLPSLDIVTVFTVTSSVRSRWSLGGSFQFLTFCDFGS